MSDERELSKEEAASGVWSGRKGPLPSRAEVGWRVYLVQLLERYALPTFVGLALVALVFLVPTFMLFMAVLLVMLTPCVLLHEWGHYRVARRAGLEVSEFSIGFGPRVWSRVSSRTGVRWSLKALPVGGSVSVAGMTVELAQREGVVRDRAFIYASVWTRLRLTLAGVGVNLVLAVLAFMVIGLVLSLQRGVPPVAAVLGAPLFGVLLFGQLLAATVGALWSVVASLGASGEVSTILTAPTAMQEGLVSAVGAGVSPVLYYVFVFAGLNLSLGILNLLPLYPLDGGHALTAVVDGVRKVWLRVRGTPEAFSPLPAARFAVFNKATGFAFFAFIALLYGRDFVRLLLGAQ